MIKSFVIFSAGLTFYVLFSITLDILCFLSFSVVRERTKSIANARKASIYNHILSTGRSAATGARCPMFALIVVHDCLTASHVAMVGKFQETFVIFKNIFWEFSRTFQKNSKLLGNFVS